MIEANPIGISLASIFAISMGLLFFWMFHVPPVLPLPVIKVRGSVEALHKILIPIVEAIPSERAVELACRLGNGKKSELVLVHVIVVPHTLPLNAPMPEREQVAQDALDLANIIVSRYGNHVHTHIVRHRNAVDGVLEVANEEKVDAIILGVGVKNRVPGEWGKTGEEILRRANCEVIIDKVPLAAQPLNAPA